MAALHFMVGQRVGPYEVLSIIGAGGMGEVYKARDTRLERIVAIKILPSADPNAKVRFEREAKAIAALTHPHICRLYDVGHDAGTDYLVMEFIEGETLAARVQRGPLTVSDALGHALQIADGLECAHRAGIVHRDLKPANIMLTKSGIKLLDFGIVKRHPSAVEFSSAGDVPTATSLSLTAHGALIGTLPYMAPEQLEGRDADARTDIWAFGCVLYEMLTAKLAFPATGAAALVASIIHEEPAPPVGSDPIGRSVARVIRGCLAKAPEERLQSAHDIKLLLELIAAPEIAAPPAQDKTRRRFVESAAVLVALAAGVAAGVLIERGPRAGSENGPLNVSVIPTSAGRIASSPMPLAISPDGRALAYVGADSSGVDHLWYRPLDERSARMLPNTQGASEPFFSPEGTRLGFFSDGALKTISVSAGTLLTLAPAAAPMGGTWGPDHTILFCPAPPEGIRAISDTGGSSRPVLSNDRARTDGANPFRLFGGPVFLPDGRHFLYRSGVPQQDNKGMAEQAVFVSTLDGRTTSRVLPLPSNVAYTAPGLLLYMRDDALVGQEFDLASFAVKGEASPIADRVRIGTAFAGAFAASNTGRIVYVAAESKGFDAEWRDRTGRSITTIKFDDEFSSLALSPDERWLAGQRFDPVARTNQVWSYDLTRGTSSKLTDGQRNTSPVWANRSRVLYAALRYDKVLIEEQTINQTPNPVVIAPFGVHVAVVPESVTEDGRFLSLRRTDSNTDADIWVLPLTGDRKPVPIPNTKASEQSRLAPNGRWIAYSSKQADHWEVYVQPFPTDGRVWKASTDGGADPQWRGDSRELFYLRPDRMLVATTVVTEDPFALSPPVPLFPTSIVDLVTERNHYVVSHDGQKFLFAAPPGGEGLPPNITLLVNWRKPPAR